VVEPQGADGRPRSVSEVFIERGLRALVIIAGLIWLGYVLRVDVASISGENALGWRIVRGLFTTVAVVLLADVTWHVIRAALDAKLASTALAADSDTEAGVRRARLRTVLPIVRNMILIAIAVIAGLIALSSLGVDIGPLIAGAGVFGVAIGFGAQTLVRDIISGVFYLLDDAFRVGEYIQSGSFKGTVESFSLRSVKLRHHRGPIYTVPFGQLGAVQNMSRDWVIDKLVVSVEYDTDLEKTRKLLKKIGVTLQEDPELAPLIIEPLKMQGVEEFGDYAIKIRMKMTTRPGEQFTVRRKAYALIKQKFEEAGIKFAHPRVEVAGGADSVAAAAHEMLELQKRAAVVP
jgi:small-conductance mechanosensitive channel